MTISIEQRTDERVLVINDRFDAVLAPQIREQLDALLDSTNEVTIDLSQIEFIDSAGLAALVFGMKRARKQGGELHLIRPVQRQAFRIFELTKFDAVFSFVEG